MPRHSNPETNALNLRGYSVATIIEWSPNETTYVCKRENGLWSMFNLPVTDIPLTQADRVGFLATHKPYVWDNGDFLQQLMGEVNRRRDNGYISDTAMEQVTWVLNYVFFESTS